MVNNDQKSIGAGVFGNAMAMDIVFDFGEKPLPSQDQKERAERSYFQTGGNSVNAAFMFAALGGHPLCTVSLGHNTPFRDKVLSDFETFGVDLIDCATPDFELPHSAIALTRDSTGTRAYRTLWTSAKDPDYKPETTPKDQISEARIMMTDLYYKDQAEELIHHMNVNKVPVVCDVDKWQDYYADLLPKIDYVVASEKLRPPGCETVEDTLEFLKNSGCQNVAITRGHLPIIGFEKGVYFEIPVPEVEAVDTLGCGDVFRGALSAFLLSYENQKGAHLSKFQHGLTLAGEVAAEFCTHKGHELTMHLLMARQDAEKCIEEKQSKKAAKTRDETGVDVSFGSDTPVQDLRNEP